MNHQVLIDKITNWILDYAKQNGKNSLVYGYSGGINSSLINYICSKQTKLKIFPVHFPNKYNSHVSISNSINQYNIAFDEETPSEELRHAMMMSILTSIASKNNGIVIGCLDRNREHLIRYYHKYAIADIYPTADLFREEIEKLLIAVGDGKTVEINRERSSWHEKNIGLTWKEIEWADSQNSLSNIIEAAELPDKKKNWFMYTSRQKEIISKTHHLEKKTLHKKNNRPKLQLRNTKYVL